jgi:hypothetical protein
LILDAGILRLYHPATSGAAAPGNRPEDAMEVYYAAWYGERVVGYNRFYTAQGAGTQVDRVVRCVRPRAPVNVTPESRGGDLCRLADGYLYRVRQAQYLRDEESGEDVVDLSLERIGERYEKEALTS